MSPTSASLAEKLGYTNVKVYHAGMPDWKKNGGMELAEAKGLRKLIADEASFVLIDLRSEQAVKKGHIPGTVNIPAKKLKGAKDVMPRNKKAPIYLVDDGVNVKAFKTLKGWGYKKVSVLNGGFKAFDGKLATGAAPAPDKIVYVKKLPKGQISIKEFKEIAKTQPADKLILDVRDAGAEGTIKGALSIPEAEVKANLKKIPRDREIIVHCNTGVLASSVRDILEKNGYKVRYLNAVIQVAADGSFEVAEK